MQRAQIYPLWVVGPDGLQTKNYTRIGDNFRAYEYACRCGCSPILIHPLLGFGVQCLRNYIGESIYVNSGYRCARHNYKIGGHPTSYHMQGLAADICTASKQNMGKLLLIALGLSELGGVGKYVNKDGLILWIHIDYRPLIKGQTAPVQWEKVIE